MFSCFHWPNWFVSLLLLLFSSVFGHSILGVMFWKWKTSLKVKYSFSFQFASLSVFSGTGSGEICGCWGWERPVTSVPQKTGDTIYWGSGSESGMGQTQDIWIHVTITIKTFCTILGYLCAQTIYQTATPVSQSPTHMQKNGFQMIDTFKSEGKNAVSERMLYPAFITI